MAQGDGIFANRRLSGRAAFLAAVALTAMTAPAMAGVTDFTIFRSSENEQTGPSSSTNLFYYFSSFADVDSTVRLHLRDPDGADFDSLQHVGSKFRPTRLLDLFEPRTY
jgi:hypothetical protein